MGWKVVSLIFLLAAIVFLPFWPIPWPFPQEARFVITGFCLFVAVLTFLVHLVGRRGSSLWKGPGQG